MSNLDIFYNDNWVDKSDKIYVNPIYDPYFLGEDIALKIYKVIIHVENQNFSIFSDSTYYIHKRIISYFTYRLIVRKLMELYDESYTDVSTNRFYWINCRNI